MKKILILGVIAAALAGFYFSGGEKWLLPATYQALYQENPLQTAGLFFAIYVLVTALSVPGAAVMTLIGGAVFGLTSGLLLISFASSIGATLAFLMSRTLLKDWVQAKFGGYLGTINKGMEKDGSFYLFTLRLIPVVPFFAINLLMGLMPISAFRFYWVSQLGMLAGTAVFVNAGAQLGSLETLSLSGILNPQLIGAFVLLGIFPWIARFIVGGIVGRIQARQKISERSQGRKKPTAFDDNLIVIGAGAAGLVSSYIGAAVKARVTLIEKHRMGGDCLNTGCVPSKAIIHAAKVATDARKGLDKGLLKNADGVTPEVDFSAVMEHVHQSIRDIEPHDSVERYESLGVNCISASARIISPWEVEISYPDGKTEVRSAPNIIIATGGRPRVPDIPGLDTVTHYTSDTLWDISELPRKLLVLGGGPIGCELGQTFARLGSDVTMVDRGAHPMPREDEDVARLVEASMKSDGLNYLGGHQIVSVQAGEGVNHATLENGDTVEFDVLLIAAGRVANTQGLGLEEMNIATDRNGFVEVDEYLQTSCPTIYACGDVIGGYQFTHVSAHEAWFASVNSLFGVFKRFKADYRVIPWATFTAPEVGRVGLNETDARAKGIAYEVTQYGLDDLDRAITDDAAHGFVRVLTEPGKDRILGATIVGPRADDLISTFVIAMKHGLGLNKVLGTIHSYPTYSEANKYVAGEWKRNHVSAAVLRWLGKYHSRKIRKMPGD